MSTDMAPFAAFEAKLDRVLGEVAQTRILVEVLDDKVRLTAEVTAGLGETLHARINDLEQRMVARFETLEGAVQRNSADIYLNRTEIRSAHGAILENRAEIAKNRDAIQQNSQEIAKNRDAIRENSKEITRNRDAIR